MLSLTKYLYENFKVENDRKYTRNELKILYKGLTHPNCGHRQYDCITNNTNHDKVI